MEMENIYGMMAEGIKEHGRRINFMGMVYTPGQMEGLMREIILMTENKALESILGLTVKSMRVIGVMGNNMGRDYLQIVKVRIEWVCGKMATE